MTTKQGQSPIFVRTETFMRWLLHHTMGFPKYERFRLAKRIDDTLMDFYECLLRAAKTRDEEALRQADVKLDLLRAYLRLSAELKHTSPEQFHFASQQAAEIGRLLGGWLKKPASE